MNSALSKNIDEYDDPHDLEVEYQDFLSELHEWLPESCNSFGKMMSHISSSAQLNMIDELAGKVMNFISVALGSVLPEPVKEVLQNRAVQGIMKVTGGVTQITAGCGLCTTLAGAFAGVPMIILGANMAIEGIQDLWHVVKGDLDVQSKNLLKEATGHKVDNILDLAEFVSTMGSAKAASKMSSKAFMEASSRLRSELNKARKVGTAVSEEARLTSRAARQFIRRECGAFRGPKRFAKPVDFGRLFKKHGVKTAPGSGLQPLSEAELEKVVSGAKDPSWRPSGKSNIQLFVHQAEDVENSIFVSIKAILKNADLPVTGKIRYIPPEGWTPKQPLPRLNGGYIDKFGNIWIKGPSRTAGQPFEWDVQLSRTGRNQMGWLSRDGSHLNISLDGEVTHK